MKLYLVRHGRAVDMQQNPLCPLSMEGVEAINKLGEKLSQQQLEIKQIYHSEPLRTEQTAVILAKALKPIKGLIKTKNLEASASLDPMLNLIEASDEDILCVSHEPYILRLVSYLTTGHNHYQFIKLSPGSIVCMERQDSKWLITEVN